MSKKVVAIDVDLTVVDSLTPWLNWFTMETGKEVKNEESSYDLVPEMIRLIKESGVEPFDPMEFWRKPDLYNDLNPIEGSVEAIKQLNKEYEVIFVSSCVTEHTNSKISFLQRHFGHHIKFISTFHKEYVAYDYLIDDRLHHMIAGNAMRPDATHILFTQLRSDGTFYQRMGVQQAKSWKQILNFFFPEY